MTRPISVILNPAAGRGQAAKLVRELVGRLGPILETSGPGDAERLARRAADDGGIVVAAGGDGTVGEVAAGIYGSDATLAILPVGTGNDFARTLGVASLPVALAAIDQRTAKPIDLIRWRCGDAGGLAINIAGCGFDALVAERINKGFRYLRGTSAYIAAVLTTLRSYRPAALTVIVDGETIETTVMLCAVANAKSYGGGMLVAPNAEVDDGELDLVVVEGIGKVEFLRAFPSVFKGAHLTHPRVRSIRGRSISIHAEPPLPVLSDGELVGVTPAEFEVIHNALKVVVP
ncbi:diacylglycerol/lipid kinase family protein [Fimbriimonas ginsengisoli]|uniref:Transcription regulator n=1 Tax=Fimbriimonas ginsengisoli Gsoil 348 TaxID=661478 RepID=A0A068NYW2_FIMGI|nr:diacylglycerol kinase family protein [Fimbriimonas ginsengisoli]AIE87519.1 Transcription regulator [Fimbriimonas ginsengisoli Gsoil 348]